jgi:hypothetical protein
VHARTRVENNILNQLRHCLVAGNLHCALVRWQALSQSKATKRLSCEAVTNS